MVPGTEAHHERKTHGGLTGDNHGSFGTSTGLGSGGNYETSSSNAGLAHIGSGKQPRPRLADDNASTASIKSGILGTKQSDLTDPILPGSSGLGGNSLPDRSVGATALPDRSVPVTGVPLVATGSTHSTGNFGGERAGNFGAEGDIYHRNESKSDGCIL